MSNPENIVDWTVGVEGRSNTSARYAELCSEVERLIRESAHLLIAGQADGVARLIVSQLAHAHGMAPAPGNTHRTTVSPVDDPDLGPDFCSIWSCTCGARSDRPYATPLAKRQAQAHREQDGGATRG